MPRSIEHHPTVRKSWTIFNPDLVRDDVGLGERIPVRQLEEGLHRVAASKVGCGEDFNSYQIVSFLVNVEGVTFISVKIKIETFTSKRNLNLKMGISFKFPLLLALLLLQKFQLPLYGRLHQLIHLHVAIRDNFHVGDIKVGDGGLLVDKERNRPENGRGKTSEGATLERHGWRGTWCGT